MGREACTGYHTCFPIPSQGLQQAGRKGGRIPRGALSWKPCSSCARGGLRQSSEPQELPTLYSESYCSVWVSLSQGARRFLCREKGSLGCVLLEGGS